MYYISAGVISTHMKLCEGKTPQNKKQSKRTKKNNASVLQFYCEINSAKPTLGR